MVMSVPTQATEVVDIDGFGEAGEYVLSVQFIHFSP